jgi:hypothetical protein
MNLNQLIETNNLEYNGYLPVVDYGAWRVATLGYVAELLPINIHELQKHNETDEVFVLVRGRCILFIGEGGEEMNVHGVDMKPLTTYNIKKGTWHSHTLSEDGIVVIVENRDTSDLNSENISLNKNQRSRLIEITSNLWKGKSI